MKKRASATLFTVFFICSLYGCEKNPGSSPDPEIKPNVLELVDVNLTPWVTKPDEPFTLEVFVRGEVGPEIHLYTDFGVSIGPDGTLIPAIPSNLMQNGVEAEYLVLHKDESYEENQMWLESRFTADNIILPVEDNGIAVSTIWDIMILEPDQFQSFNTSRVLLSFRSAEPDVIGQPPVTQLAPDVLATSRIIQIVSDQLDDITRHGMSQLTDRYYSFYPDDRDFLIVQKPPNVDTSAGGRFFISGEREKGLGDDAFRNPALFSSSGRLKGVILSLRGIYSLSATGEKDFCLLIHEILHRWAAHVGEPLAREDKHWSDDRDAGLDRAHSGFGLDRICTLNDFELYLAGLIPADSITAPLNRNGYTIDDFINDNGSREPAFPETQRDFTIGFIVESDEPLSDHEIAYFHYLAKEVTESSSPHGRTWFEATGERSFLNSELPAVNQ